MPGRLSRLWNIKAPRTSRVNGGKEIARGRRSECSGKDIHVGDKVLINNVNPIIVEEITDTYISAYGKDGKSTPTHKE